MQNRDSSRAIAFARARRAAKDWVDAYRPAGKLHPARCLHCGATEWQGRWMWGDAPPDLAPVTCPACARIRDGVPAHVLELSGALPPWWNEVRGMIGNVERAEAAEHPMERVMKVEVAGDRVLVATTGVHLARRLAGAIVRRWRRTVRLRFAEHTTSIEWLEPRESRR